MIASRRMPIEKWGPTSTPWPSGPRCTIEASIRSRRAGSEPAKPAIPHIAGQITGPRRFGSTIADGPRARRTVSGVAGPGWQPRVADAAVIHDAPTEGEGWRYLHLDPADDVEACRAVTLAARDTPGGHKFPELEPAQRALSERLAAELGLAAPTAALVHRDRALPWHRDELHPYPCRNITLVLCEGTSGGELIAFLPEGPIGFACPDRTLIVFDGQCLHGVAPIVFDRPDGYRLGLTFYSPLDPADLQIRAERR